MKIRYKIIYYKNCFDIEKIYGLYEEIFNDEEIFTNVIDKIVKSKVKKEIYYVSIDNIYEITWNKILNKELMDWIIEPSNDYKWLNYDLKSVENLFEISKDIIKITINGPASAMGATGEYESIINSNK